MLAFFAKRTIAAFGRKWDYDTTYMRDIVDAAGVGAILPLSALGKVSHYRRSLPRDVYYAAKVTAAVAADCGPCAQLHVAMAEADGVNETTLRALVAGDADALTEDERLGHDFARAVLARDDAGPFRERVARRWGMRGVVSLAYALVAAQAYPTFKYATGHAHACTRLRVGGCEIVASGRMRD